MLTKFGKMALQTFFYIFNFLSPIPYMRLEFDSCKSSLVIDVYPNYSTLNTKI